MSWIPGWETVSGASWWSGLFFWASIGSLLLLGLTEVISHRYSERKDELAEQAQRTEKNEHDLEIARLHRETADANEATEKLRRENLELEQAISPRLLVIDKSIEPLRAYENTEVRLFAVAEYETRRLAGGIGEVLRTAKWKSPIPFSLSDNEPDGVSVQYVMQVPPFAVMEQKDPNFREHVNNSQKELAETQVLTDRRKRVADTVVKFLQDQKIEARAYPVPSHQLVVMRWPEGMSPEGIVIRVGLKPTRYFMEQKYPVFKAGREQAEAAMKAAQEQMDRMHQRMLETK